MKKVKNPQARRAQLGFTLVELLVVVLVIGVLAAIAVPQYFKVVEKSRAGEIEDSLGTIIASEERYLAKTGSYSSSFASFDVVLPNMGDGTGTGSGSGAFGSAAPGTGYTKDYVVVLSAAAGTYTVAFNRNAGAPTDYGAYTITYTCKAGGTCTGSESNCGTAGLCDQLVNVTPPTGPTGGSGT